MHTAQAYASHLPGLSKWPSCHEHHPSHVKAVRLINTMTAPINFTDTIGPIVPIAPIFPNFITCDSYYGVGLSYPAAQLALDGLSPGGNVVEYLINDDTAEHHLPLEVKAGNVAIKVDYAGPFLDRKDLPVRLVPRYLRGLAAYVAENCISVGGNGGFATVGIETLIAYVTDLHYDIKHLPYPESTIFATVTIGSSMRYLPPPGSYDPATARALQQAEGRAIKSDTPTEQAANYITRAAVWARRALVMRMGLNAWWEFELESNSTVTGEEGSDGVATPGGSDGGQATVLRRHGEAPDPNGARSRRRRV